jgi:hypothetical protein
MSTVRANAFLDSAGGNTATINGVTPALSSQAQAIAGTDNTTQMTPLRNLQAGLGAPHFMLEDQKASGTNGQTVASASVWTTRDLNTEVFDPGSIVSIASNEFTTTVACWVEWQSVGRDAHMTRLYNVTDATTVSTSTTATATGIGQVTSGGGAVVAGKAYRIELNTAGAGQTHVAAAGRGVPECYLRIRGWRSA